MCMHGLNRTYTSKQNGSGNPSFMNVIFDLIGRSVFFLLNGTGEIGVEIVGVLCSLR